MENNDEFFSFKEIFFELQKISIAKLWRPDHILMFCDNKNKKIRLSTEKDESSGVVCVHDFEKENLCSEEILHFLVCKKCGLIKK